MYLKQVVPQTCLPANLYSFLLFVDFEKARTCRCSTNKNQETNLCSQSSLSDDRLFFLEKSLSPAVSERNVKKRLEAIFIA